MNVNNDSTGGFMDKEFRNLADIVSKKKILLEEMLEYTRSQSQAITEDSLEQLQKLIDKKQKRIETINRLDDEFENIFNQVKKGMGAESLEEIKAGNINGVLTLKNLVADVMKLVKEIGVVEEENRNKAKRLLNAFGSKIKNIKNGKKTNNAYRQGYFAAPSYFIDKKK